MQGHGKLAWLMASPGKSVSWEHAGKAQSCQSLPMKKPLPILISKLFSSLFTVMFVSSYFHFLLFLFLLLIFSWATQNFCELQNQGWFPTTKGQVLFCLCVCVFLSLFILWGSCAYQGLWRDTMNIRGTSTDTLPPYLASQNAQELKNIEISFSST